MRPFPSEIAPPVRVDALIATGPKGASAFEPERRLQPRTTYAQVMASPQAVSRAESDYQRLRAAYLEVARNEPGHEVALAMVGADMDRAHARLQSLMGLPRLPFTHEPSAVLRREALRTGENGS